ncbi:MAG: AAA family ATPase [Sporichthyaceae bacterium]
MPQPSTEATPAIRLRGVTVCGPPPIGRVHIPLTDPLLALYGRNGAGKTRLLNAVIAALRGQRLDDSWGLVHVDVLGAEVDMDELGDAWRMALARGMREHLNRLRGDVVAHFARRRDEEFDEGGGDDYVEVLEDFRSFTSAVVEEAHSPDDMQELVMAHFAAHATLFDDTEPTAEALRFHAPLIAEVAAGGHFVLRATGTRTEPRWAVYAAASPTAPEAGAVIAQDRARPEPNEADEANPSWLTAGGAPDPGQPSNSGFPWRDLSDVSEPFIGGRGYPSPARPVGPGDVASVPWPDWASVPVLEVASISAGFVAMVTDETTTDDVDRLTREYILRAAAGKVLASFAAGGATLHPDVEPLLSALTANASRFLHYVFPDAPKLAFAPGDPNAWLAGQLPIWIAHFPDGTSLPLRALSTAQKRWASLSCALAVSMASRGSLPVTFLCDEPESGLHRRAEAELPDALVRIARESGVRIAVATHSPALLDPGRASLVHVARLGSGAATAQPMDLDLRAEIERESMSSHLGLTPADLLQMVRCIVIVEGKHDEVVLGGLLASDLDAWSVIYPVGGAKQMVSLANAGLLWDFTDAAIVIVVDNIARTTIAPVWDKVQRLVAAGRTEAAVRALVPLGKLPGAEARWMQNLLTRAIRARRAHRIRLETLSAPDVVCYLPAEEFVPGKSWDELLGEWRESFGDREATNVKAFLTQRYGVNFNTDMIARIAVNAKPDAELRALGGRIRELAAFGPWAPSDEPGQARPDAAPASVPSSVPAGAPAAPSAPSAAPSAPSASAPAASSMPASGSAAPSTSTSAPAASSEPAPDYRPAAPTARPASASARPAAPRPATPRPATPRPAAARPSAPRPDAPKPERPPKGDL